MISGSAYQAGLDALTAGGFGIPDWFKNIKVGSPTYQPKDLGGGNIELKPGHIVSNSSMDWANQNSPYLKAGWDSPAAQASYGSQGQYGGSSNTGLSGVVNQQARRQGGKEGGGGRYRNQGQSYNQGGQNPWTTTGGWNPPAANMSNPSYGYTTPPEGYGTPYNPYQGTNQQAGTWQDQSAWGSNTQYQPPVGGSATMPNYGQPGDRQPGQHRNSVYNPQSSYSTYSSYGSAPEQPAVDPNANHGYASAWQDPYGDSYDPQKMIQTLGYDPHPFASLSGQAATDYYNETSKSNPYMYTPDQWNSLKASM